MKRSKILNTKRSNPLSVAEAVRRTVVFGKNGWNEKVLGENFFGYRQGIASLRRKILISFKFSAAARNDGEGSIF